MLSGEKLAAMSIHRYKLHLFLAFSKMSKR